MKNKFKVGEKVRVIRKDHYYFKEGEICIITKKENNLYQLNGYYWMSKIELKKLRKGNNKYGYQGPRDSKGRFCSKKYNYVRKIELLIGQGYNHKSRIGILERRVERLERKVWTGK